MSRLYRFPSKGLLKHLRQAVNGPELVASGFACPARAIYTSRSLAKQESSFREQLYASTQRGLDRDREEQRRFARVGGEGGAGRPAAILFSMPQSIRRQFAVAKPI